MRRFPNIISFILLTGFLVVSFVSLYFLQPAFLNKINNMMIDTAITFHGKTPHDERITIVDIDEKSLKELGQWPWSRNKIALILDNLTRAGAAIIGLDIVFAEKDNSSPLNIADDLNISAKDLPDYDKILAKTLTQTPTVTGFIFDFKSSSNNTAPATDAMFIQRGGTGMQTMLQAKGVTPNIPLLQQNSLYSGSFNTIPDKDGIVRRIPLVIAYDDSIYSSLSFEMVRAMLGTRRVDILYDQNGIEHIETGGISIPTDDAGRMFVNYHGGARTYTYLSATDIYHNRFDPAQVKDHIILIGTSAAGLLDLRATPFESTYPGVEVHANAIDNIINQDFIQTPSYTRGITLVLILLSSIISAFIILNTTPFFSFTLSVAFLGLLTTFLYQMLFHEHLLLNFAYPLLASVSTISLLSFLKIYKENRQKEIIADKFAKKVSPQVAAQLLKNRENIFMTTEAEITIFFSDIRNFTTISESFASPKILIEYLNTYMSPMSEIIISHEGTIDKYIGDAIMAYWNAPLPVKNHADKALSAAIKQIEALEKLNKTLQQKNFPPIDIGIGIHTGKAIVGEMGSSGRSDYTVIGDTINLGSRIEGLCKPYGAKILISEDTRERLEGLYKIREIDRVQVKGKDTAVTIYEVIGFGKFDRDEAALHKEYRYALKLYKEARFQEAYLLFAALHEKEPHKLYALYMDRCEAYARKNIKDFDAVHRFTTK
jgi:adenylate cyclase